MTKAADMFAMLRAGPAFNDEQDIMNTAADFIAHQERRIEALREALKPFADQADMYDECAQHPDGCPDNFQAGENPYLTVGNFRLAHRALENEQ